MTVRSLNCPQCKTAINVPATMQTARCPGCGKVFSAAAASAASDATNSSAHDGDEDPARRSDSSHAKSEGSTGKPIDDPTMIYVACGGALAFLVMAGVVGFLLFSPTNSQLEKQAASADTLTSVEPALRQATPEELASLTIARVPEDQRRRIYDDMRKTAKMTKEKPLMLPDGRVRGSVERMLGGTYDYSIKQLAALHDLNEQDIRDIVAEGDMKNWDPSDRSRAYRDGERLHPNETATR